MIKGTNPEYQKYKPDVMGLRFNLILARCSNNGIGFKGTLPWSLRNEMNYFVRMTKEVKDPTKQNAVIMGRRTWESMPNKFKPMPDRINFVLSTQPLALNGAVHCTSFDDLLTKLKLPEYADKIETCWIIGGSKLYEEAIKLNLCHKVYLTKILKEFECDTFVNIDFTEGFREISDERVSKEVQEENQIQYTFHVYEKIH